MTWLGRRAGLFAMAIIMGLLAACGEKEPIIIEKPVIVEKAVHSPCVQGERPDEVTPVKQRVSRSQWNRMTTDQRDKLLTSNGMDRKAYSEQLYVATSGCK